MLGFFFSFFVIWQILPDYKNGRFLYCGADKGIYLQKKKSEKVFTPKGVFGELKIVKDNKLYIKYKDEILKTYVILESSTLPSGRLKGDIDNDGVINIWDVTLLYMHIRGKRVITDEEALEAGKLTGSQSVTLGDVTRLYRYIRGKIDEL